MPSDRETPFTLRHIDIKVETDKAVLIVDADGEEHWIPLQDVFEIKRSPNFFDSQVVMSMWIARQEGLV